MLINGEFVLDYDDLDAMFITEYHDGHEDLVDHSDYYKSC